jgi:phytanoyl-CoA hydroxylase
MKAAAKAAGTKAPEPFFIEVLAGSCVFHCGETWHGSAANTTSDKMRRAIGIHMLPENVLFSDRSGGYIYRRYQHTGFLDHPLRPMARSIHSIAPLKYSPT